MPKGELQAILGEVEKPSRYLGTEVNRVIKNPADVTLRLVLAFPDLYEIGTSHFGIQILYHLLNRHTEIAVERVFAPAKDMEKALRNAHIPLCSLESQTPLRRFHILGFSLLYELNFTNVLNMLDLAGIPLYAEQRSGEDPIVIAGGPCVSNPEPMAPFFDAMVFGDGETVLPAMADLWMSWKKEDGCDRTALLSLWARLEGVYIPAFFKAADEDGFQRLIPIDAGYSKVKRTVVHDLDGAFFPDKPILPFGKPVHDRLRLEISRGCGRGCRFCQAGMIYRPVRERSMRTLLDLAERSLAATGYEDLSLLSLSTGDHSCLLPLIETLMRRCRSDRVAVSLPSIRAGTLTPALMEQIKKVRKTGFTIAPEAGSQRLRDVINKNISLDEIQATVSDAFAMGWQIIKLYFMIGLPTETDADLDAIVQLVSGLNKIKSPARRRRGQINVSVTTFIPKAHTPFQWASQISADEAWSKINHLKSKLRMPGVQIKWQHPAMSLLEGVVARADRRIAAVIERAWRLGCTFDGWSDHFNFERWRQAFDECGQSIDFFTTRSRSLEEHLPWAHMDSRVELDFLKSQWQAAQQGIIAPGCREGHCHQCGVCDFKILKPRQSTPETAQWSDSARADIALERYRRMELIYTKRQQARFFGHLELANIFARALRRAKIDMLYSQGFHPMPRISFDDPLPLGMESYAERMWVRVAPQVQCRELIEGLSACMPQGITIASCREIPVNQPNKTFEEDHYQIRIPAGIGELEQITRFTRHDTWTYCRRRKGRTYTIDLKRYVQKFERIDADTLEMVILRNSACTVRPADILRSVCNMDEQRLALVRVIKLAPAALHNG
ncbi:MAG: TIGR03960 family B12-binding radical SAM protein [Desulfobacteraceae bacterium]|nr:MAG: TIGR03960 family B12-binding radical SAM protein [Desulfobacteraceae bacterium]